MKHALLGACLGWLGCAMFAPSLWLTGVASAVSLIYLTMGLITHGKLPEEVE